MVMNMDNMSTDLQLQLRYYSAANTKMCLVILIMEGYIKATS